MVGRVTGFTDVQAALRLIHYCPNRLDNPDADGHRHELEKVLLQVRTGTIRSWPHQSWSRSRN